MPLAYKYESRREGEWNLRVPSGHWDPFLWGQVLEILKNEAPTRHPQVKRFRFRHENKEEDFYLKTYYCENGSERVKSLFRHSKAFQAFRQGEALRREGFRVPTVVFAGEDRKRGLLQRAFFLTLAIEGLSLISFLRQHFLEPPDAKRLRDKRAYLRQLAEEVARLHRCGFVHGDLTPVNILLRTGTEGASFFFLDNDRTRRYPSWFPHWLWRRNLVQLNRFQLPGILLQDRIRFLRHYLSKRRWSKSDRRLIAWLEKQTRERRAWKDRFRGELSFRQRMKWDGRTKKSKVDSWPA